MPRILNQILVFLVIMTLFAIAFLIIRILSSGKVEIELTEKSFRHIWVKKFLFSKEIDIELDWHEIVKYTGSRHRLTETFQLNLTNNRKYRIHRWVDFFLKPKDDFAKFEHDFPNYFKRTVKLKG